MIEFETGMAIEMAGAYGHVDVMSFLLSLC